MRRHALLVLPALLLGASPSWAQADASAAKGEAIEAASDAASTETAEAGATGGVVDESTPRGEDCKWPVQLLWHNEPKDGPWQMGVSVLNKSSGQQVPGLRAEHFQVFLDDSAAGFAEDSPVRQSANAFMLAQPEGEDPATSMGVDPVNYDVYFAVDMTASMGEMVEDGAKPQSKLYKALQIVHTLVQPRSNGTSLFDERDRIYVSGFTSSLQTQFMSSTSADRQKIQRALADILEFTPTDENAALYASILHNLSNIQAQAQEYKDPASKREAVLIVITDSFNGMDVQGRRSLRYCSKNDPLTDTVQQALLDTQQATDGSLKVYLLGMGNEGEPRYYSLTEPPNRRCRIATVQREILDVRSLRTLGQRQLTRGGYMGSNDPRVLLKFVKEQFEALKSAYELTYIAPADIGRPRSFKVLVSIGDSMCLDEDLLTSNIVPQSRGSVADTKPYELAMFLASLILAAFFVPRFLVNLANLGGGPAPAKPKRKGKKKRKKRR